MIEYIILAVGLVLLIIIGFILLRRRRRNKKLKEAIINNPPQELIDELNQVGEEFERRKEQDENTSPHQVLWDHARPKRFTESNGSIARAEQPVNNRELHQQFARSQDIQSIHYPGDEKFSEGNRQPNRNPHRNIFRRIRRRRRT